MGNLALAQRDYAGARQCLEESLAIRIEIGDKERVISCLEGFAKLASGEGLADRALRLFAAVATLRQGMGALLMTGEQGDFDQAVKSAREALDEQAAFGAWAEGAQMDLDGAVVVALASAPG
jgi:hypothetical protein